MGCPLKEIFVLAEKMTLESYINLFLVTIWIYFYTFVIRFSCITFSNKYKTDGSMPEAEKINMTMFNEWDEIYFSIFFTANIFRYRPPKFCEPYMAHGSDGLLYSRVKFILDNELDPIQINSEKFS